MASILAHPHSPSINFAFPDGEIVRVDAADAHFLNEYSWRIVRTHPTASTPYVMAVLREGGKQKALYLHRLIMNAKRGQLVDHVNGDGLDCRRSNMRIATSSQNCRNRKRPCDATNPYRGVYQLKTQKQWNARICVHGEKHYLGYFETAEEAAHAYDRAARQLHGAFARLNFPEERGGDD